MKKSEMRRGRMEKEGEVYRGEEKRRVGGGKKWGWGLYASRAARYSTSIHGILKTGLFPVQFSNLGHPTYLYG